MENRQNNGEGKDMGPPNVKREIHHSHSGGEKKTKSSNKEGYSDRGTADPSAKANRVQPTRIGKESVQNKRRGGGIRVVPAYRGKNPTLNYFQ